MFDRPTPRLSSFLIYRFGVPCFFNSHILNRYLNAIQTNCPWILRYLTAAVITNKRRRNVVKDLIKVIQQEKNTYRDPITQFVECLYVNFDFEEAQAKLLECEKVRYGNRHIIANASVARCPLRRGFFVSVNGVDVVVVAPAYRINSQRRLHVTCQKHIGKHADIVCGGARTVVCLRVTNTFVGLQHVNM